jgi:hypothetical protein
MAAGYSEAYANEVMSMLCETKSDSFRQVLDRAGVTDDAMARRHNELLHSHEGSDIAAALRLGYQVKGYMPTAHGRVEAMLKEVGASQEEAKRSVELVKRTSKDPHEIAATCEKYMAWYRRTFPGGREEER